MYKFDADCPDYRCIAFYSLDKLAERSQLAYDKSVTGFRVAVCDSDNATFVFGELSVHYTVTASFFVLDVAAIISFPVCIVHVMDC